MVDFPEIETPRLVLRVLTLADAAAVHRHFSDAAVTRFMDMSPCKSVDEARAIILFHAGDTGCRWGLFCKDTGDLLGTCGFHCWVEGPRGQAEIGYDLGSAYWGQGLMREALQAAISFGFAVMRLDRIEASVHPQNERSLGLLRKLGFRLRPAPLDPLLWFSLLQADWTAAAARGGCRGAHVRK